MGKNLIEYIISKTKLRQTDIAKELGVSRAQITKWKNGEFIPFDRRDSLIELAGIFSDDIEWVELVGSKENATAWCQYMVRMNEISEADVYTIKDDAELYTSFILLDLKKAGIPIPTTAPSVQYLDDEEYDFTPFDSVIYDFFDSYRCYLGWASTHVTSIDHTDLFDTAFTLEHLAIGLSICSISNELVNNADGDLKAIESFRHITDKECRSELDTFCSTMAQSRIPFETDYYNYVNKGPYWLEDDDLLSSEKNSVLDHLPYGEREIIKQNDFIKELLEELHIKIDTLLSEQHKEGLSSELKHTCPNDNQYLISLNSTK